MVQRYTFILILISYYHFFSFHPDVLPLVVVTTFMIIKTAKAFDNRFSVLLIINNSFIFIVNVSQALILR